jgi:hypothetical protein
LISIIAGAAWAALGGAIVRSTEALRSARTTRTAVVVYGVTRTVAARVRPPYWEAAVPVERSADGIRLRYIDGDPDTYAEIITRDGRYEIAIDGEPVVSVAIEPADVGIVRSNAGLPLGLAVTVASRSFFAPFAHTVLEATR